MNIQIVNISSKPIFEEYCSKYNIFRELREPDLKGLEVRCINLENADKLKSFFLKNRELCYILKNGEVYDLLALGSLSSFKEIANEMAANGFDEIGRSILIRITNYSKYQSTPVILGSDIHPANNLIIMGILNVTPDSFSDGGKYFKLKDAFAHAEKLINNGCSIVDVGGESTRPGAKSISSKEQLKRVIPVIKRIRDTYADIHISIDSTNSEVVEEALNNGADIINDISGGTFDPKMFEVASKFDVPMILMHIKGTPQNMQENPTYKNVVNDIYDFFENQISFATRKGVNKIIVDPGIGFGKTVKDNYEIINRIDEFKSLGKPILIGLSRKSFLGKSLDLEVGDRDLPTAIAETIAVMKGAKIIRTHSVENARRISEISQFVFNPELANNV